MDLGPYLDVPLKIVVLWELRLHFHASGEDTLEILRVFQALHEIFYPLEEFHLVVLVDEHEAPAFFEVARDFLQQLRVRADDLDHVAHDDDVELLWLERGPAPEVGAGAEFVSI